MRRKILRLAVAYQVAAAYLAQREGHEKEKPLSAAAPTFILSETFCRELEQYSRFRYIM